MSITPPCSRCGASIHDHGRAPFIYLDGLAVCHQCRLADDPDAFTCAECGMLEQSTGWANGTRLVARSLCFSCDLWVDRVAERGSPGKVIVDGRWYGYDPTCPMRGGRPEHRGFGGRRFAILLADGTTVVTDNLWTGGEIPERFRDRLPDDARFVTDREPDRDVATAIRTVGDRVADLVDGAPS